MATKYIQESQKQRARGYFIFLLYLKKKVHKTVFFVNKIK